MKTGFILRCDVIVDIIKSLAVTTTTRELYMEEAPEMFEVRADDNQGKPTVVLIFNLVKFRDVHSTVKLIYETSAEMRFL